MTAIAAALQHAGYDASADRAYVLAIEILRGVEDGSMIHVGGFIDALRKEGSHPLFAIVPEADLRRHAEVYLRSVLRDLKRGRDQTSDEPQAQGVFASLTKSSGTGHGDPDGPQQSAGAAGPKLVGEAKTALNPKNGVLPGKPPRGLAQIASIQGTIAKSIMDSLKIDGVPIGDWTIGQCLSFGRSKERESYMLRVLGARYRHLPHTKVIRELTSDAEIASLERQAEEFSHAT